MAFRWRPQFSVNIAEIDEQHKKLFEIGSRIFSIASLDNNNDHYDEIMEVLDELKNYTIYHFGYEEKLLAENGFDEFDNHKIEHNFFIKKLERIGRKDIDGQQAETLTDMVTFIADWISSHILKNDMRYKELLNEKGIS